jgi:peptidoglycan/LPS O-acetylase OafA/YrhL
MFHGGVAALGGGFLGVDAFFVLSGFLITSLLFAEYRQSRRIDLPAFWERRACRLLPALLLIPGAVVVVSRWELSPEELPALRTDVVAAIAYVANWRMMNRGGGYFAETAAPSPLQHTWSLGIEEQLYLLWPLIVVALLVLARRHGQGVLLVVCGVGAATSAVAAARLFDPADVDRSYYGTGIRASALLAGAALAVALAGRTVDTDAPPVTRRVLGVLAGAGAGVTGWLWVSVDGADPWLYRGGFVAPRSRSSPCSRMPRSLRVRRRRGCSPSLRWCGWGGSRTASICGTGRCSSG